MNEELIQMEERNIKRLRFFVDLAQAVLAQSNVTIQEASSIMEDTRKAALSLFPDKEFVYDLVCAPRLRRIVSERFTIPGSKSGRN